MGIDEQEKLAHKLIDQVREVNAIILACEEARLRVALDVDNCVAAANGAWHAELRVEVALVLGALKRRGA